MLQILIVPISQDAGCINGCEGPRTGIDTQEEYSADTGIVTVLLTEDATGQGFPAS